MSKSVCAKLVYVFVVLAEDLSIVLETAIWGMKSEDDEPETAIRDAHRDVRGK